MRSLMALACVLAVSAATVDAQVVGWRGDGTGKYPDAHPPLAWGRIAESVKELSAQARRPQNDEPPAGENAIPDGVIRQWLVLGPLPTGEDGKSDDVLPDARTLSPDENEKAGGLAWRAVTLDSGCMDLCALMNIAPDRKGFAAYAHTYIYSPSGRPVGFNHLF